MKIFTYTEFTNRNINALYINMLYIKNVFIMVPNYKYSKYIYNT